MADPIFDPALEWLDHIRPEGLVVAPALLKELDLVPERQTQADTALVGETLNQGEGPALTDPWPFFQRVLGWTAPLVAGAPGGPPLPDDLTRSVPGHDTVLTPHWAVRAAGAPEGWQLLVRIEAPDVAPDKRGALGGWEASAHQRFERLLRESGVNAGVLLTANELRLVYAPPRGETSGWLVWPLRPLATVAGRPMLGGLKLLLSGFRLFNDAEPRRLPALLKRSRESQAQVSTRLAEQVLGALHELLRGLYAAEPDLIGQLARERPAHLYEGLLTVLMRLVFVLYAEDRDLIPSSTGEAARALYHENYSVRGLFARLSEDAARNPDTMDERLGGWGRLLALFRLVHAGDGAGWVQARGGKLFDPDAFPFLEARRDAADPPRVAKVSDGCLHRLLEGLMTIEDRGSKARERLSYRALDVEQIGSVYETVMGFTVQQASGASLAIKAGKNNRTPVFVDLERLARTKPGERAKLLKEEYDRSQLSKAQQAALREAGTPEALAAALDSIADERGSPGKRPSAKGAPILQPTDERRRTGSHYTPHTLTEPIVRHALEPAFERLGPDARPEEILELKVCDPAMGSGAFLVEACRALGQRLVKAWGRWPETRPAIPPDEDEELHARRLVAQRCLYGVDKNPMATDLAKLSLWLATLAREHEFTFLDHALKSGDSLVGLTRAQMAAAHWDESQLGLPILKAVMKQRFDEAVQGRREIREAPDDVARAVQEVRYRMIEKNMDQPRAMGDAIVAAFFSSEKPKERERARAEVEGWLSSAGADAMEKVIDFAAHLSAGAHPIKPLHWEIEFPEVFARKDSGFDVIVGNPPFAGKNAIAKGTRAGFPTWLQTIHTDAHGNSDLVAHFFRRAFTLMRKTGVFGLIATNTVRQGDTRETGLTFILTHGGAILRAIRRLKWPGEAAVVVSVVHVTKGKPGISTLDGRVVQRISAYLVDGNFDQSPWLLGTLADFVFQGTNPVGAGFLFDDIRARKGETTSVATMRRIIASDSELSGFVKEYTSGDDVANHVKHLSTRYVVDFGDLSEREAREKGGALFELVERLVRPVRQKDNRDHRRVNWWKHGEPQKGLYEAIKGLNAVLVSPQTSPHLQVARRNNSGIFASTVIVFAFNLLSLFAALQSRIHETWARFFASSMKDDLRYTPSDCFATFPFPRNFETDPALETAGTTYHDHRAALMIARNQGMTPTYNRFHNSSDMDDDIVRLRALHAEMDAAVLRAYGWDDLAARAAPFFLDETTEPDHTYQGRLFWPAEFRDEVLARLLALNAQRHAEEVAAGLAPRRSRGVGESDEDEGAEAA